MHQAAQESARRHHHGLRVILHFERRLHAIDLAVLDQELMGLALFAIQVRLAFADPFEAELIRLLVALRAGSPDGRAFSGVQHPELESGHVRVLAHLAAEGINLAGEMALGQATDGRVAGHLADGIEIDGEQERLATHACGGERGLHAGVACSHHDHIIPLRINEHGRENSHCRTECKGENAHLNLEKAVEPRMNTNGHR